jgi:hypothetical protein
MAGRNTDRASQAYDWLITIDAESTHVWSRRWGIIEFLYMFSRYMPFADTPVMLIYREIFIHVPFNLESGAFVMMQIFTWWIRALKHVALL